MLQALFKGTGIHLQFLYNEHQVCGKYDLGASGPDQGCLWFQVQRGRKCSAPMHACSSSKGGALLPSLHYSWSQDQEPFLTEGKPVLCELESPSREIQQDPALTERGCVDNHTHSHHTILRKALSRIRPGHFGTAGEAGAL